MKTANMKKSIILLICASLTLVFSTYAWFLNSTSGDVANLKFLTSDTIEVKFWGYNEATSQFDIELDDGDLQLAGLKGGNSVTIRIELIRNENNAKDVYIKMLGVEIVGVDGGLPYEVTVNGTGYTLADFVSVNVMTVEETPQSITINASPSNDGEVFFSETGEGIAKILEIVQGYNWDKSDLEEDPSLFLDMVVSLERNIYVEDENNDMVEININEFQKQSVRTRSLNVQGVDR